MKKALLSAVSCMALAGSLFTQTVSAKAATNEELLLENLALKAEIAALRARAQKHNRKAFNKSNAPEQLPSLPSIIGDTVESSVVAPLWTGVYAGLNAGYGLGTTASAANSGWSNPDINPYSLDVFLFGPPEVIAAARTIANSGSGRGLSQNGFIGGGQAGYNFELNQYLIAGLETDIQGAGIRGTGNANGAAAIGNSYVNITSNVVQAGVDWLGTVRARIGYRVMPEAMIYGTGGLSYGGVFLNTSPVSSIISSIHSENAPTQWTNNSGQRTLVGWVVGAGGEWMLSKNWSVKSEALYYDLGSMNVTNTQFYAGSDTIIHGYPSLVGGATTTAYYTGILARLGVNYHFNFASAPVVAKF